jgi:hypothetical protein
MFSFAQHCQKPLVDPMRPAALPMGTLVPPTQRGRKVEDVMPPSNWLGPEGSGCRMNLRTILPVRAQRRRSEGLYRFRMSLLSGNVWAFIPSGATFGFNSFIAAFSGDAVRLRSDIEGHAHKAQLKISTCGCQEEYLSAGVPRASLGQKVREYLLNQRPVDPAPPQGGRKERGKSNRCPS